MSTTAFEAHSGHPSFSGGFATHVLLGHHEFCRAKESIEMQGSAHALVLVPFCTCVLPEAPPPLHWASYATQTSTSGVQAPVPPEEQEDLGVSCVPRVTVPC